ncbi:isoamylase [Verrucomicrobiales bacterium BCK34]|nr:isoamylase [Verrucomicrobiales bacterium BCK34]
MSIPFNTNRAQRLLREGSAFPLGVSRDGEGFNFAIYSKHAYAVELLFFQDHDLFEPVYRYDFEVGLNKSGPIWHCRFSDAELSGAEYYAYRIAGPEPGVGYNRHAFDPEKLLLDPYATSIFFPDSYDREAARRPGSTLGCAPLAVLPDDCEREGNARLRRGKRLNERELIIYELHVGGFTRNRNSGVESSLQGTFSGLVEKIPYLLELGITAVELMPVFQFDPGSEDYWGYMPVSFFAPHHGYSSRPESCRQHEEFCEMVAALHDAGIEVILDVVYNHTAEGDENGPVFSLKGIDNSTYYMLSGNGARPYANFSGTGNTIHTRNRAVRQLIIDSIRYWAVDAGVDGFRFDLASVFSRNPDGSVSPDEAPIFGELASHPELADLRLIAEPWDASGYSQLGHRFPGTLWRQWNSAYRDTLQRFVRGDRGLVGDLMTRLYGSSDYFSDEREYSFHPFQSVNYFSSHDGFTLYDLTAYNEKNNWANGHGNLDGAPDASWNCGWEGDLNVPGEVVKLRRKQAKNFFCLLMLSNGTPMFRMGDEFLNSQGGNSNPYNQNNETSWLDWRQLEENGDVFRFFREMISFRKTHPTISRSRFWREDIHWYGASGAPDLSDESQQIAWYLAGAAENDDDLYVMINAGEKAVPFHVAEGDPEEWVTTVDTSIESPGDIVPAAQAKPLVSRIFRVQDRSVVVLVRRRKGD